MRKIDLYSGGTQIRKALEHLDETWQQANQEWDDVVSQKFAELHLEPLIPEVKLALDAVSRMQILFDQAQRDCES